MNMKYIAALVVLLSLGAVQITLIWLVETSITLRLILVGLTLFTLFAFLLFARASWDRYQRLTAAVHESRQLSKTIRTLSEQNSALTKKVSEFNQAKENIIGQQTKLFDLVQEHNSKSSR